MSGEQSLASIIAEGRRLAEQLDTPDAGPEEATAFTDHTTGHFLTLADAYEAMDREVERLKQLPCESLQANKWLNEHAPEHVLESLWAWRRQTDNGLALHKAEVARLREDLSQWRRCECDQLQPGMQPCRKCEEDAALAGEAD